MSSKVCELYLRRRPAVRVPFLGQSETKPFLESLGQVVVYTPYLQIGEGLFHRALLPATRGLPAWHELQLGSQAHRQQGWVHSGNSITQISYSSPARLEEKAMRSPQGDQVGLVS